MVRHVLQFVLLYVLTTSQIHAQNLEKLERKAQKAFFFEEFHEAMEAYNELLAVNKRHKLARYRLQICSLLTDYRTLPIETILVYKKTQGRKDKFFNYWLGRIYFAQSNFKKAIETWQAFLTSEKYKSSEIINETKEFIKWAEIANDQYSHPQNYEIEQLSDKVNSPYTEYSPVYFKNKDELLFLTNKNSIVPGEGFQIFHTYRQGGLWSTPTPLEQFGTFTASNANIEVVNNDARLYVYKDEGHKFGDLYYSEKVGDQWISVRKVDEGMAHNKLESHFFINKDENRILFAHRKTNKPFDLDIYESRKSTESGKWEKPNLFAIEISSEHDEDFPYLSPDEQTIYFSSKGHETIGGYDVFKSTYDADLEYWSSPESLKYPTNSTDDDIQFKIDHETNSGYFVSNRIDSYGGFDIFFFHESAKVLISGTVYEGKGKPADHAQIQFYPSRKTNLTVKAMTDANGRFSIKTGNDDLVKVKIFFHDDLVYTGEFETPHSTGELVEMGKDFYLEKEKGDPEPVIDEHVDPTYDDVEVIGSKFRESNKAKLSNIYFDFGSHKLHEENHPRLESLLQALRDYPKLVVEIAGHTDNVGELDYNLRLSLQRAQSVCNYLSDNGISSNRLIPKGYGDLKPLATNDDEREGRELNRRIEVVVIE